MRGGADATSGIASNPAVGELSDLLMDLGASTIWCNAVIFTTGCGTPTGNAIVPVLKVTANARTYKAMEDNIDVDMSAIITGEKTYKEMGRELVGVIHDVCNGRLTKAEAYGFSDIAVDHVCRFV